MMLVIILLEKKKCNMLILKSICKFFGCGILFIFTLLLFQSCKNDSDGVDPNNG